MCHPTKMANALMEQLFSWLYEAKDRENPLILASVFHYKFVFIHPFGDDGGRTARLWQTALLSKWEEIFAYIPIEKYIIQIIMETLTNL